MSTILIVDDDRDTRDVLSTALSMDGWAIQTTDSLLGALAILQQSPQVRCILLDYNLPGMPMEEFVKQIDALIPKVQIVLISAQDRIKEKATKHGFKYYLAKPIDFDELRKIIAMFSDAGKQK